MASIRIKKETEEGTSQTRRETVEMVHTYKVRDAGNDLKGGGLSNRTIRRKRSPPPIQPTERGCVPGGLATGARGPIQTYSTRPDRRRNILVRGESRPARRNLQGGPAMGARGPFQAYFMGSDRCRNLHVREESRPARCFSSGLATGAGGLLTYSTWTDRRRNTPVRGKSRPDRCRDRTH